MDVLPNEILYHILHLLYNKGNTHEFIKLCRINKQYHSIILDIIKREDPPDDIAKLFKFKLTKDENVLIYVDWKKLGSLWTNAHQVLIYYLTQTSYKKQEKVKICNLYADGVTSSGFNPGLYDEFYNMCIQKLNIYSYRNNKVNKIFTPDSKCEDKLLRTVKAFTYETGYTYHTNYKQIIELISTYKLISKCCELYSSQMLSICVMLKLPIEGKFEDKNAFINDVGDFWKQLQHKTVKIELINSVILKRFASEYSNIFDTIEWERDGSLIKDMSVIGDIIFGKHSKHLTKYNWRNRYSNDDKYSGLRSSIWDTPNTLPQIHMDNLSEYELKLALNMSVIEILRPIVSNDDVENFMERFECIEDKYSVLDGLVKTFTQNVPIQILHYLKVMGHEVKLVVFQDELLSLSPEQVEFVLSNHYVVVD